MNIFRNMKNRILSLFFLLLIFTSCKKLKVEYFEIAEDCEPYAIDWADTLILPEVGIHYVAVDTANCMLVVKYDEDKASVSWINEFLVNHQMNFIRQEELKDSLLAADTLVLEDVYEKVEQDLIVSPVKIEEVPVVEPESVQPVETIKKQDSLILPAKMKEDTL